MRIFIAPLNWGLGHASRCVPLVQRLLDEGHEVVIGGDGESLTLLRRHFPTLRFVYLAPLQLTYSSGKRQVLAMLRAMPKLIAWAYKDHCLLKALLKEEHFDRVISDNRFGLYNKTTECVYITHQLHIMLPKGWRWAEPIASRMHAHIYTRYNKVWVPDYEESKLSLAGEISHPQDLRLDDLRCTIEYIGPLSRFQSSKHQNFESSSPRIFNKKYDVVAVLSGLEPQRTMLEKDILARFHGTEKQVLIVEGLIHRPNTRIQRANITIVPHLSDDELASALNGAAHIIARSGYSTIMDLNALGILQSSITNDQSPIIEFIPTPGQPEQEYLASWREKCMFK